MICYQLTMWRCNTRKIKKYNSASSYIFISGILFCILGQTPYPFCHAKRESDVLGGWVCQNKFIMMFCVTKWFQRKSHFKRKINKKLQRTHFCFPFHHGTCTGRIFKFCLCNQSGSFCSHFTLFFTKCRKGKSKKPRHRCITIICRYL